MLEDDTPVELLVERGDGGEPGSIHLGRVVQVVRSLRAVLVDIGSDRPAFLAERDMLQRSPRLTEGARAIVQIRREAQGGKAARLTMAVTLRGRYVELIRGGSGLARTEALPPEEQASLLQVLTTGRAGTLPRYALQPEAGLGLRVLKAAPGGALARDATTLMQHWHRIHELAIGREPPVRLDPGPTFAAALAARTSAPDRVILDDAAAIPETRKAFPYSRVEQQKDSGWPIDLDAAYDQALASTVAIGGGSMHIETTRTAVLIDIDSGTQPNESLGSVALSTNLAATGEVARQLRLRNVGGGVVVDFIGFDRPRLREHVRAALAEALASDPALPRILGWTQLGHLELVRPRRGRPLAEILCDWQPNRVPLKSVRTVMFEALRALYRAARTEPGRNWRLLAAPEVAAALCADPADNLHALERRLGREITVGAKASLGRERFHVTAA